MTEALYVVVKVTFGDFFMNAAMLKEQKRNKKNRQTNGQQRNTTQFQSYQLFNQSADISESRGMRIKTSGQMSLVVHGPVVVDDRYKRFATTFTSPVK